MLMTTVQLSGSADYDSQMLIHTSTANTDISLSRKFQNYLSYPTRAHVFLYQSKDIKHSSKRKWTECEYHVQDRRYVPHTSMKMLYVTTQLLEQTFFGPHAELHGVRWLSEHYHFRLYPKLVHATCMDVGKSSFK